MFQSIKNNSILIQWIDWWFRDVAGDIFKAWKNFLSFGLNYFSLILLLKTFFSPWRRYSWSYGKSFSITKYLEVFFSNSISRILGAIVRSFLLLIGIMVEFFFLLAGLIVFIGWLILPLLLIGGIIFGIKIIL
jgi:hypothetical protein